MKALDSDILSFISTMVDINDPQLLINHFTKGLDSFFPDSNIYFSKTHDNSQHEAIELKAANLSYGFLDITACR